ncbi:odorant receptor Or1-like isoform X2 [Ceratina calcarata]|uniref:Odorant receptor n=1 Tax=Ceratina calcarata TaxID=156304 RepID=A0AAJ7IXD0_9HYME|nr:odorant receptor Or1-like isoform X2 [Ceratina calcarata]
MSAVAKAEEDLIYVTEYVKPILTIVGAWPLPTKSSLPSKIVHRIEHALSYFLFFLLIVPSLMYVFLKEKNPKVKLKLMGPIINCAMQIFKYTILLYRMNDIRRSLDSIRQDWMDATEENRLIFLEKAKTGRRIALTAVITIYGGGFCYRTILPLLRGTIVTPQNITIRLLPCPAYFIIFNEQLTPNYEILFLLQVLAGFVTYTVIGGSCGISALLVLHVCSMLRILFNKIKNLVAGNTVMNEMEVYRRIKDVVDYQAKIKRFLKNIESITEYICLIEMMGGTCLICLVGYCILLEWENHNATAIIILLMLSTSFVFCVFIFCYVGQLLVDESQSVSQMSRTVDWYLLEAKDARSLILIIAMSNYPMRLTAGKMLGLSLTTFTDVMKLSVGYLNILREVV